MYNLPYTLPNDCELPEELQLLDIMLECDDYEYPDPTVGITLGGFNYIAPVTSLLEDSIADELSSWWGFILDKYEGNIQASITHHLYKQYSEEYLT